MKIEVVNDSLFDTFLSDKYQIVSTNSATDEYKQDRSLDYKRLIKTLNEGIDTFLPSIDKTIPLIFYNLSAWTKMKSRANVFIQDPNLKTFLGKLTTSYQAGTESIYISKNLYEDQKKDKEVNEHEVYKYLLASDCTHEEVTNLILLHEIGHAIHHQLEKRDDCLLESTTAEASFLNPFVQFNGECVEGIPTVTAIAYKAITEGFADLYSCILIDRLYDWSRSDVIINALYQYRVSHKNENYYSDQSIESYLNQRIGRGFKNFDETCKYISATIAYNAVKYIGESLRDGKPELGRFLGVINKLHSLNCNRLDKTVETIKNIYPFMKHMIFYADKKNPFSYHPDLFAEGCKAGDKWINKKAKKSSRTKYKTLK